MDKSVSQVQRSYDLISKMIFSYQLPPGAVVSDFSLSKKFGISRTPIRSAIMMLVSDGIVEQQGNGFKVIKITKEKIDDLYEARLCLEVGILSLAMQKGILSETLDELREIVKKEDEYLKEKKYIPALEADLEFHNKIVHLCKNKSLESSYRSLSLQMRFLNVFSLAAPNDNAADEYFQIIKCIEAGNLDNAVMLLTENIERGCAQKINAIGKFGMYGLEGMFNFISSYFEEYEQEETNGHKEC